jgi:hypothetical protein
MNYLYKTTFFEETPEDNFNPISHGGFFVSRLTAKGHMRHPFKADLGEK